MPPGLPDGPSRDGQQLSSLETGPYILIIETNRKGCAVQHQNAPNNTFATEQLAESAPRIAQTPTVSHIDADIEAIRELRVRIEHLWGNLAAPSREDLSARLDLLGTAADHRATDSRPVREALQEVLLSIGTGALAALSEPTRQRLADLTGIALPGHPPVAGWRSAAEMPEDRGGAPGASQLAGLPEAVTDKGAGN
jgi:hypothetical protein